MQQSVAETRALKRGTLRVGISTPATILGLLRRFADRYPGIELSLQAGNTSELQRALEGNRVDVIVASQLTCKRQFFNVSLGRQRIVLVAARDHPLAGRGAVTPQELADQPIVLREEGSVTRSVFLAALHAAKVAPRPVASLGSREMVKEAAAAGLGLGVVFDGEVGEDARLATLRLDCDADLGAEVFLTCRSELAELGSVGALIRLAAEETAAAT